MTAGWKNAGTLPTSEAAARSALAKLEPGEVLTFDGGDSRVECHGGIGGYGISWRDTGGDWEGLEIGKSLDGVIGDLRFDYDAIKED